MESKKKKMKLVNITKEKQDFPGVAVGKNLPAGVGDMGLIPGPGRVCCGIVVVVCGATKAQLNPCASTAEPVL